ncbi:MAG: HAD hydrolase IA variant 1 family protein [Spirochaetes bacterium]|nr:MAG: HAD hydrolase IA variant 1 family protein [Spirochaetota bacterium]
MAADISTVIFDCGQVITLGWNTAYVEKMARLLKAEIEAFKTAYVAERGEYDRGTVAVEDYWRAVALRLGEPMDSSLVRELSSLDMDSWFTINPDTVAMARQLGEQGCRILMLSNMNLEGKLRMYGRARWLGGEDWISYFDDIILSCDVGLIKPERKIYELCLGRAAAPAEACLFIDDIEKNLDAAREMGIKTHLFTDAAALEEVLRIEYGLLAEVEP